MLSISSPLHAAQNEPGTLPVVSETTIPAPAQLMQHAVVTTETPETSTELAPLTEEEPQAVPTDRQTQCIATAMYYEAKGEPLSGKKAVAYVILNRVQAGKWKSTPCGVVTQPKQFSWYRSGMIGKIPTKVKNTYLTLASEVINTYSRENDPTGGATYFHATWCHPGWKNVTRIATIGGHIFYR
jgi:spore germination cell wall hydrolase CwlJ-like protein